MTPSPAFTLIFFAALAVLFIENLIQATIILTKLTLCVSSYIYELSTTPGRKPVGLDTWAEAFADV